MFRNKKAKKRARPEFQTIEQLREAIREEMNTRMEGGIPRGLPKAERDKYLLQLRQLRKALRECAYGDEGEKNYLKSCLRQEIARLELSLEEKERLYPFLHEEKLTAARKFDILLFLEMKQSGKDAI